MLKDINNISKFIENALEDINKTVEKNIREMMAKEGFKVNKPIIDIVEYQSNIKKQMVGKGYSLTAEYVLPGTAMYKLKKHGKLLSWFITGYKNDHEFVVTEVQYIKEGNE